ncbi:MAG TPA: histidine phosphatase family protein, partial [Nannocystis exedens]|nr:histidine phosphatase family protein [Nannocystis exedens]
MSKLFAALIRHGDYEQPPGVPSAHLPHPLTAKGRAQASALGAALAARELAGEFRIETQIDTSTLRRAWQTGLLIAQSLEAKLGRSFEIVSFDALCERSMGAMANLHVDEIARIIADDPRFQALPPGWKARSACKLPVPGAESLLEAGARVATHVDGRLRALACQNAKPADTQTDTLKLFVSHGAALRHAAVSLGTLRLEQIPGLSMHHCQPVHLERNAEG